MVSFPRESTATPTAAAGIRQGHPARVAEEEAVLRLWNREAIANGQISANHHLQDGARNGKSRSLGIGVADCWNGGGGGGVHGIGGCC
jgi:hypothetical protein